MWDLHLVNFGETNWNNIGGWPILLSYPDCSHPVPSTEPGFPVAKPGHWATTLARGQTESDSLVLSQHSAPLPEEGDPHSKGSEAGVGPEPMMQEPSTRQYPVGANVA